MADDKSRDSLQTDLLRLCNWSDKWLMKFNTDKCKVMHFGKLNRNYDYTMNGVNLTTVDVHRDLGIDISHDMKVSAQTLKAYNKASRLLGMLKRTIVYKHPRIMVNLYKSLVRPNLEFCTSAWSPHYKKDKEMLERVQHRFTRMIKQVSHLGYEQRLCELKLWSLEERRNRADLIELFKMYKGYVVGFDDFFTLDSKCKGTRGHTAKLLKARCVSDVRKFFFSHRVINRWNSLDQETISSDSVVAFKSRLSKLRDTRMGLFLD